MRDTARVAAAPAAAPPVTRATKIFYGFGSIAYGIKDNGFQTFVLLFYNQLVGLPADWVGEAIFIALLIDAFMDPVIGQMSDHWRSRWGRRHPFMYFSAVPVAISYVLVWNPPHTSRGLLFAYLLVVAVVVRTFITFYEIPSSALSAELTQDYDERTSILGYRYFFGWFGGLGMVFLAYAVFLRPTAKYPVGQLNPDGYLRYGMTAAVLMLAAILISAAGTHKRIPWLRQPPAHAPRSLSGLLREMFATLSHRSFLMMVLVGLFAAMGQGLNFALALYFNTYLWELSAAQILIVTSTVLAGALMATMLAPLASRRMGKKAAAMLLLVLGIAAGVTPITLRMLGHFPANHTPLLLPSLMLAVAIAASFAIGAAILISSMIADVVEDSEVRTGRRSEGLFFAANSFVQKAVTGFGLMLSGLILAAAHFPAHAKPGHLPPGVLERLTLIYVPSYVGLYAIALGFLALYKIDRAGHEANLVRLAQAAAAAEIGEEIEHIRTLS
ncbi:MFS transporter [Phenylobacterium montanum]|uniref:MFS transporter n=1 Tax=Phenylobacterium montanum TaxID=2823693 RepID=A0A975G3E1_9CAUL|nr:MFS transporter [Caulobacter sp. S6]QUD90064.1 MFS transporter [Caulobacter sp. S6]